MQERGDNKLPSIGVAHTAVANTKIIANKTRPICFEKKLHRKNRDIEREQGEQDNARLLAPAPGKGKLLSPG